MLANRLHRVIKGPPTISVADATADEVENATVDFTVTLSRTPTETVTADYATDDGTTDNAATAGADYTQATGTLTFTPSDTTKTVSVSVLDDRDHEDDETFILTQSGASGAGAWIGNTTANGTIMETDPAPQKELARFQRTASVRTVKSFNTRDA